MVFDAVLASPIGKLGIQTNQDSLLAIHFLSDEIKTERPASDLSKEVVRQLSAYFDKKLTAFDLPIHYPSSTFKQSVLNCLRLIPFGKTVTYGDVAKKLNTGPRAVGNACRHNPVPLVIPCHRVIAQNHIGGYSGARFGQLLKIKTWLLEHENHLTHTHE